MKILVIYATTDGQTAKIAHFVGDLLSQRGDNAEVHDCRNVTDIDISLFDAVILAGSVHMGKYKKSLRKFAKRHALSLNTMKAAFLSVSLTAAGTGAGETAELAKYISTLESKTGWKPETVIHVAGALRFKKYGYFRGLVMKMIAESKGEHFESGADKEYTDWRALGAALDAWSNQKGT